MSSLQLPGSLQFIEMNLWMAMQLKIWHTCHLYLGRHHCFWCDILISGYQQVKFMENSYFSLAGASHDEPQRAWFF